MTRIAWVADVHLGNHLRWGGPIVNAMNTRCRDVLTTLQLAVDKARELGCSEFVILGDLFDTSRPSPQLVAATQKVLGQQPGEMRVSVLLGNHDMVSMAEGDHALGPLAPLKNVEVVSCPAVWGLRDGWQCILVPFQVGRARDWLPGAVKEALEAGGTGKVNGRFLGIHLGVQHAGTPPFLADAKDSITVEELRSLMEEHEISAVLAGNWHNRYRADLKEGTILQVGTVSPTGFDNPGVKGYGTLAILDTSLSGKDRVTHVEIPGPRFVISEAPAPLVKVMAKHQASEAGWRLYVKRISEDQEEKVKDAAELRALQEEGKIAGFEVDVDRGEARAKLATAAHEARRATSADEAVSRYVGRMPLETGVERADVLAAVIDCLKE